MKHFAKVDYQSDFILESPEEIMAAKEFVRERQRIAGDKYNYTEGCLVWTYVTPDGTNYLFMKSQSFTEIMKCNEAFALFCLQTLKQDQP